MDKKRGPALAELLQELVNKKVADGKSRPELIDEMAEAAGVLHDTVNEVIKGSIICPAAHRLEAYAKVLGVAPDRLIKAAIRDGCDLQRGVEVEANNLFWNFFNGIKRLLGGGQEGGPVEVDGIKRLLGGGQENNTEVERKIVDVDSWDGGASNYSSTAAYCDASLINVNSGDREDWKQSHCMLPIRREEDGKGDYVRQAVHAAAGGHGIGQVKKPGDVDQATWDSKVKAAAKKIIRAYEQMDETAPDNVFKIAGKEPKRVLSVPEMYDMLWNITYRDEVESPEEMRFPVDIFVDEGEVFAIMSKNGQLVRVALRVVGDEMYVGEEQPVLQTFVPKARTQVARLANGRTRIVQIVSTSVLNRVGEIDSRALFDSFIAYAEETNEWPVVDVLHYNNIRVGQIVPGGLMRDEYCYINVWDFDDTPIGRAAAENFTKDPDYWGASIQFSATDFELEEVAEGVRLPVYKSGVHKFTSIVPESGAAALFTARKIERRNQMQMTDVEYQRLVELVGADMAEEFRSLSNGTNKTIRDKHMITREAEETEETEETEEVQETVATVATETETETEVIEINFEDEDVVQAVATAVVSLPDFAKQIAPVLREVAVAEITNVANLLKEMKEELTAQNAATNERIKALEADDETKRNLWLKDLPSSTVVNVSTHRPRIDRGQEEEEPEKSDSVSMAEVAANTMQGWATPRRSPA